MGIIPAIFLLYLTTSVPRGQSLVASFLEMYVDPLPQMPKLYGYANKGGKPTATSLKIGMYQKTWKFHRDLPPTPVFVFGASATAATFPGPTIVARQGVPLTIRWENYLPKSHILPWDKTIPTAVPNRGGVPTVVHLHGGIHPPQSDGNVLAWFTAGFAEKGPAWSLASYTYPNVQPPGNLWYHDHALGLTRINLLAGLLGAYVIQKPSVDDDLGDITDSEYDRHLVIVDRSFNADGTLYMNATGNNPSVHPQWQPEYFGDAIIVNGKAWPYLTVRPRRYRFRIINASNARYFRLSLANGLHFIVIGSDSSYLASPVSTRSILLAPAEIVDVVIDFSRSSVNVTELVNDAPYPYPTGTPAGPLNGKVMRFLIKPEKVGLANNFTAPKEVNHAAVAVGDATVKRYITMYEYLSESGQSTHLYINGRRFEDPATETPKPGTTELWNVINLTGDNHPLHIHLGILQAIRVQELLDLPTFYNCMTTNNDAVKCNVAAHAVGKLLPIPEHEKTWKNVVKIEPGFMTSVVVKFKIVDTNQSFPFDVTTEPGYVYHCHILDHEDNSMMRPLKFIA
ncbi:unnamed protein product [Spirodela intermedia]|uniref:Uncharacterized protein n=1 Tax=Spirodela intermedia TaxID=51605 RepID=A0A7I8KWD6_SPIIN|nr:unnamed protein product [Spirodela intermedia]